MKIYRITIVFQEAIPEYKSFWSRLKGRPSGFGPLEKVSEAVLSDEEVTEVRKGKLTEDVLKKFGFEINSLTRVGKIL